MNTLFIISTIFLMAVLAFVAYKYIKMNTFDGIRTDVYQLFLKAEHQYNKTGKQKMTYVVQKARSMLPNWANIFITDELLEKTLQIWFDGVKDLLDDGKLNNSEKGGQ